MSLRRKEIAETKRRRQKKLTKNEERNAEICNGQNRVWPEVISYVKENKQDVVGTRDDDKHNIE
jgi:hypothetical protein